MAKPSPHSTKNNKRPSTPSTKHCKHVFLEQWWLIKAEKDVDSKRLAVAGFTHQGQKGTWLFSSEPIVKTHDMCTLQAADGVTIFINGRIDKIRSCKYGFTPEVCNHFLIGFPYDWDDSHYHRAEVFIPTSISCLLSDQHNVKDRNSREKSIKEKLGDAPKDPVLQVTTEFSGPGRHATEIGSLPTSISFLLNDRDNFMDGGSKKKSSKVKLDDVHKDPGLLVNGESSRLADVEMHRTEIEIENEIGGTESVSNASCGKIDSQNKSKSPLQTRRSSRLINMKKGTDANETANFKPASLGSDLASGNVINGTSGDKDGLESRVELHGKTDRASKRNLLDISSINPRVSVNCGDDTKENNTTLDHLIKVGPENLGEEHLNICVSNEQSSVDNGGSNRNSSKENLYDVVNDPGLQVNAEFSGLADFELNTRETETENGIGRTEFFLSASCDKMNSKNKSMSPLKTRRTSRLINVKKATDVPETAKNKAASLGSDLVSGDVMDCTCCGKYGAESRVELHARTNDVSNCNMIGISTIKPRVSVKCGDDIAQKDMAGDHSTKGGPENLAGEHLNRCLLNDKGNVKDGGCKGNSSREKLVHTFGDLVLQVNAEISDPTDDELHTTENNIGRPRIILSASCGKMNSKKESISPRKTRRSSRLINVSKATDSKETADEVISGELVIGDVIDCRLGDKDGAESRVEPDEDTSHFSKHNLRGMSPSDPTVLANCCDDITQNATIKEHSIKLGPENLGEEELIKCSSKAVASCDKVNNTNKPGGPSEARRSSRLKITKDGINSTHETEITMALCSDLLRSAVNEKGPVSRGKDEWGTSSDESGETMYESSLEADSHNNKLGESQSKARRRLEFVTDASSALVIKERNDSLSLLSPDESNFKRTRSGRLVLPPLDYWRNQRAIYDMGRGCVGVLNGLSLAQSSTGYKSGSVNKKQKLI